MTTPHPAMLQLWTKYGKLPKKIQNRSAPKLTDSSELSELAHRNFWLVIETTRCAFPSRPVPSHLSFVSHWTRPGVYWC